MIQVMATTRPLVGEIAHQAIFEEAVRAESRRLFAIAFGILRNSGEAEDAVQETMMHAWRAWHQLRDEAKRRPWLTRICVNHCLRRRGHLLRRWLQIPEDRQFVDESWYDHADPDLDRACRKLSAKQRAVVTLHYHHGYSLDECAEMLGTAPGTVRSHLARALGSLRKELGDE